MNNCLLYIMYSIPSFLVYNLTEHCGQLHFQINSDQTTTDHTIVFMCRYARLAVLADKTINKCVFQQHWE